MGEELDEEGVEEEQVEWMFSGIDDFFSLHISVYLTTTDVSLHLFNGASRRRFPW